MLPAWLKPTPDEYRIAQVGVPQLWGVVEHDGKAHHRCVVIEIFCIGVDHLRLCVFHPQKLIVAGPLQKKLILIDFFKQ